MTERRRRERQEEFGGGEGIQPASRLFVDELLLMSLIFGYALDARGTGKNVCTAEGIGVLFRFLVYVGADGRSECSGLS